MKLSSSPEQLRDRSSLAPRALQEVARGHLGDINAGVGDGWKNRQRLYAGLTPGVALPGSQCDKVELGVFSQWAIQSASERRSAFRKHLELTLPTVGDELYQVIALSVGIAKAKSDDQFKSARLRAIEATKRLDEARRLVRYPLWGLDGGFQAIRRVPLIVSHFRDDPRTQDKVIATATSLREALDEAIFLAYKRGRRPSSFSKSNVRAQVKALNNLFRGPESDDETEALGVST